MISYKTYFSFLLLSFSSLFSAISKDDAIKGCLFGGAMGDAMGKPTEFIKSAEKIYQRYPKGIRSFADFKKEDFVTRAGAEVPVYTDDTAMSVITMLSLIHARQHNLDLNSTMNHMATGYVRDMRNADGWAAPYRAPGLTCLKNVKKLAALLGKKGRLEGQDWNVSSVDQGGCGSVMHAHPFGIAFAHDPEKAARWAAEHSKITHGAPMAQAACAAMACGIAHAINQKDYEYIYYAMIQAARTYDEQTADLMDKAVGYAIDTRHKIGGLNDHERWAALLKLSEPVYQEFLGWDARTAIAATMYTFAVTYGSDTKKAIYLGVHTPGDSDSIASMAGALIGAMDGFTALQKGWEKDLEMLEGNQELSALAHQASSC